jgi:NAD(P)-dependent dehydrogenase (short-subunit alcohol dehydrogenase family)
MLLEKAVETFGHVDVVWREEVVEGGRKGGINAGWWLDRAMGKCLVPFAHVPFLSLSLPPSLPQWVNNAGRGINKSILDVTEDDFDEMMNVNAKSAMFGMQAAYPYFVVSRNGGREEGREGGK